jgi:hypothetical protein
MPSAKNYESMKGYLGPWIKELMLCFPDVQTSAKIE